MGKVVSALWGMARPLIMLSVVLVYCDGAIIVWTIESKLDIQTFLWGLAALLPVATSIHYVNEYADYETDSLTRRTPFSGGSGVLPSGQISRSVALQAGWIWLILGSIIAVIGVATRILNINALLILLLGALGGWMYSLPPLRLAWRGWGEIDNAVLGGMALPLYGYAVQTARIDMWVVAACLPFTLVVFINLLATTWADRQADAQVGKYTLAVRLPVRSLRLIYATAASLCFIALFFLMDYILPRIVAVGSFVALPLVVWGGLRYTRIRSPHPTVFAMITLLFIQMALWFWSGS